MIVTDPLVGSVLNSRYRVDSTIARGGMAMVYKGTDLKTESVIAIKVMHAHLAADDSFVERFEREAMNAARLTHPNLISVNDQGRDGDIVYLVMEYLESVTLRKELRYRGKLTPRQAIVVTDAILAALEEVHATGMIHRDLKPDNVLLGIDGTIKLTDFGLARAVTTATTTKTLIGTVGYVAPELVTRAGADARTDLYTLGIMLYEMLTGSQPYTDEVPIQVAYRHVHDRVHAPSETLPGLSPRIDAIVLWATSPEPEDRPASATAMRAALREARATLTDAELDFGATEPAQEPLLVPSVPIDLDSAEVVAPERVPHLDEVAPPTTKGDEIAVVDDDLGEGTPTTAIAPVRRTKQVRRRRLFASLAAAAVLALVASGVVWANVSRNEPREVPTVAAGLAQADAATKIQDAGLAVAVLKEFSSDIPTGRILEIRPQAGTKLDPGATVTIIVSKGRDMVTVPTLTGGTKAEAQKAAKAAGVRIGAVDEEYSDAEKGRVLKQSVQAGSQVERNDTVNLVVSKGVKPIPVPNVKGLEFKSGYGKLLNLGFRVGKDEKYDDTVPAGRIISQYPAPGTEKKPDDLILLRVSKGKEPPTEEPKDGQSDGQPQK